MFSKANESGTVIIPTGPGQIIGDNLYSQPCTQYTRANLQVVDTSGLSWYSKACVKVGAHLTSDELRACTEARGTSITQIHIKK
jgi:hypothetical protein